MSSSSAAAFGSADSTAARRNTKRPKYSKFTQQELPACKPILTPRALELLRYLLHERYDAECIPQSNSSDKVAYIQNPSADKTCNITLNVHKHMKSPIHVYYQLDNFYQNHRRYVKSRNDEQLRDSEKWDSTSGCKPEDMANGKPIVPCGLIAWSLFNDTYIFSRNNKNLTVNKKGISWKSDRDHKFGKDVFPKNFQNGSIIGGARLNDSIPVSIYVKSCFD
ncbi:hypothetical protein Ahy_B08g090795 [Arachis hypogaea]|uniref:ALA-interacting subunit n=1 Tax=Arachis hypogaea TaxID=3818 RepID=A0A444Y0M2_ARAHY|nr:hypothetical protein Ahy_B08g090795 [Arachis hypogaea]